MRKRLLAVCLVTGLLLVLTGCGKEDGLPSGKTDGSVWTDSIHDNPASEPAIAMEDAILPLEAERFLVAPRSVGGIEPYADHWFRDQARINVDLSEELALTYSLTVGDKTTFPNGSPQGYDMDALLEWGKAPGLNVDVLHEHGFTGKGAVIAYVDQPVAEHEQFSDLTLHYTNNTDSESSMHGLAVLSLLAGKDIGTAPGAEVYYYGDASWERDQASQAECLYQIIEQNKALPEGEKITMVGFSNNINGDVKNEDVLREAVAACEEAGIMVWFCGEYGAAVFLPFSDKDDFHNLVSDVWWSGSLSDVVFVPEAGRTTASVLDGVNYIYWAFNGGLSWAMPYMLGLYAIANEIDPSLTQSDLRMLVMDTAYKNGSMSIINPVGFIAAVLDGACRSDEADALRQDAAAQERYLYAVMDPTAMNEEDLSAIGNYLAAITDAQVLTVDARAFSSMTDLEAALQANAVQRGGVVCGVQFFGTLDWDHEQLPWPTANLPLAEGAYTDFFDQYKAAEDYSKTPEVFAPNPAWPLFVGSSQITMS